MQHLKRTLAVCTAAVLCLSGASILPAGAADETLTYDVWQYTIGPGATANEEKVITLVNCAKSVKEVVIPDEIDGIPVTGLYGAIFTDCNDLTTITVGANARNLDGFVFGGCDSLMNILTVEGSSYTSRDGVLFEENDLVFCPVARTGIYTIPEDTETIRSCAFYTCAKLEGVVVPASVTEIQSTAFLECQNLRSVTIDENNPNYICRDGVVFNKAGTQLVTCTSAKEGSYTVPEHVTGIQNMAFYGCSGLIDVTLPEGLTGTGMFTFAGCLSLKSVSIPVSMQKIGMSAFYACDSLTDVYYSGTEAQWQEISIETGNENLTNAVIHFNTVAPDPVAALTYSESTDGTLTITGCDKSVTELEIPAEIDGKAVKSIEMYAFEGYTNLTNVTIPEGVRWIGWAAFAGCTSLTSITIPKSVTAIDDEAISACPNLTDVYYLGTEEQWKAVSVFPGNDSLNKAVIHFNGTEPEYTLGDVGGDSLVNASDAAMVLIAAAQIGAGDTPDLTEAQRKAADVNQDSKINASDAAVILMYAAAVGAGDKDVKIEDFVTSAQ